MDSNNKLENQPSLFKRTIAELIGTLFFVFTGAGSAIGATIALQTQSNLLIAAIANGIALALAITATMNISGGHINPAVTIAALSVRRIKSLEAISYILAQLLGAAIAGAFLMALTPTSVANTVVYGAPTLSSSINVYQGIFLEMLMTFFLVFVIFATAIDRRAPKLGGFAIGLTVTVDALIGGPLTGAAMNPARAFGPELAAFQFSNWYVYWIGPIIGAIIAALIYEYVFLK
jgi:MIP family channel proteins